jgi:hypothetical protein
MNSINIKKYDKLSMAIYVVIGSAIIAAFYPLWQAVGWQGCTLLLLRRGHVLDWGGPLSDWRQEIAMVAYRFPLLCSSGYPFHVLLDFLFCDLIKV